MKLSKFIQNGYLMSGLSNILGVLIFSKCLTNTELSSQFPEVFSRFGLISIMFWGAAYIAVARDWEKQKNLAGVFAIEKLAYVLSWFYWHSFHGQSMSKLLHNTPLTGVFYLVYGLNDLIFMVIFALAFFHGRGTKITNKSHQ